MLLNSLPKLLIAAALAGPRPAAAATPVALSAPRLDTKAQFDAFATDARGLLPTGRAVKFFIDERTPGKRTLFFINGAFTEAGQTPKYAKLHYYFARKVLQIPQSLREFNLQAYYDAPKRFTAGVVQTYGSSYGIQFFAQDRIKEQAIRDATRLVKAAVGIPGARFAFVATGKHQTTATVKAEMTANGLAPVAVEALYDELPFLSLHKGAATGVLRVFPDDPSALGPNDVVVLDELPGDLGPVAGVITAQRQDPASAVALRLKERGVPSMVWRGVTKGEATVASLAGKAVRLTVKAEGYELVADSKAAPAPGGWLPPPLTAAPAAPAAFDALCPRTPTDCLVAASRYGTAATMLAMAAHAKLLGRRTNPGTMSAKLGYDLVPRGVALPLLWQANAPALRAAAAKLGADRLVLRPSSNGEVLRGFNAIGLYPPVFAKPCKGDALLCAYRQVQRSFDAPLARAERAAAKIEGAVVTAALTPEGVGALMVSGTMVTRGINAPGVHGYTLSLRSPEADARPTEITLITVNTQAPPAYNVIRRVKPGATLLPPATMQTLVDIALTLEIAYCKYRPGYSTRCDYVPYDGDKAKSLAIGFEIRERGRIEIVDLRELGVAR